MSRRRILPSQDDDDDSDRNSSTDRDDDEQQQQQQQQQLPTSDATRKRKLGYDANDVSANCFAAKSALLHELVKMGRDGMDGMLFGFATDMRGVCAVPEETFQQMLALICIFFSEDDVADILGDAAVRMTTRGRKSSTVASCMVSVPSLVERQGSISRLWSMPVERLHTEVELMQRYASGRQRVADFTGGLRRQVAVPMQNGRMFITVHKVTYELDNRTHTKLSLVLWGLCHRNFNFVRKLVRCYSNPDVWRKKAYSGPRAQELADAQERTFELWEKVLLSCTAKLRLATLFREHEHRQSASVLDHLEQPMHPESFYALTNPVAVLNSIMWSCPDGATAVCVEGMDPGMLRDSGLTTSQYLLRAEAYQRVFHACKEEQRMQQAAEADGDDAAEEVAGDEAAAEEEEDAVVVGNDDAVDADGAEEEEAAQQQEFAGDDGEQLRAALAGEPETFSGDGRALLPVMLGWPTHTSSSECLVTGLPTTHVALVLDLAGMAGQLPAIIHKCDVSFLQSRFGDIPQRARADMQEVLMGSGDSDLANVLLAGDEQIDHLQRRTIYNAACNPLQGYLYDKVYHELQRRYLRDVVRRDEAQRLQAMQAYCANMVTHVRGDLLSMKARSMVLHTAQVYVDSLDRRIPADVRRLCDEHRGAVNKAQGDFAVHRDLYYAVFHSFNARFWALSARNLLVVLNLLWSELAWRLGTDGNFKWIGMPVTVVDQAALGDTNDGGTNIKKRPTCGYDYCREVFRQCRLSYRHVVAAAILARFADDGHYDSSTMRMTPASVGEGQIHIVDGKVAQEPSNTLATGIFLPEGLGEHAVQEEILKRIPRDDNIKHMSHTTADPDKNGMRKNVLKCSIHGFCLTMISYAQNQQPRDKETLRRWDDLSRVVTVLPASGPDDDTARAARSRAHQPLQEPLWAPLAGGAAGHGGGSVVVRLGAAAPVDAQTSARSACFFSLAHMVAQLAALQQKLGMATWNVSPSVNYVLRQAYVAFTSRLTCLLSERKIPHSSRVLDVSVLMAGVAPTTMIRAVAELCAAAAATDAIPCVVQLQREDCLHVSLLPGVLMRFLTSMLDYPVLALMACFFRETQMPVLSVQSALEFVSAQRISDAGDRRKITEYINTCLREGMLCMAHEMGGDMSEARNITLYVTARPQRSGPSSLRMTFNPAEATNKDSKALIAAKLRANVADVLRTPLVEIAQFCKDHPGASVQRALTQMMGADYNMAAFFGGFLKFYDHKAVAQAAVGAGRFAGIPNMGLSDFAFLRILPVPGTHIAYGVNMCSGVFISSLMRTHRRDWGLQVQVAESIVRFFVEKRVPYSLLPVADATMDSFADSGTVLRTRFAPEFRPLTMLRANQYATADINSEPCGVTAHGTLEDTAHMQVILGLATLVEAAEYWLLNLASWRIDVLWGLPGDETPLRAYPNNTLLPDGDENFDGHFESRDGRIAFVRVQPDNSLALFVVDAGQTTSFACSAAGSPLQHVQQQLVFGHGWGPARHFRRDGVLLRATDEHPMQTLAPWNPPEPSRLLADGFAGLRFLRDGLYLATDGENEVYLAPTDVEARIMPYGTRLGLRHSAEAMQPLLPRVTTAAGWQQVKYVFTESSVPQFALVPVALQEQVLESSTEPLCLFVSPGELFVPNEWSAGCAFVMAAA